MSDTTHELAFEAPEPEHLAALFPGYDIECLIATGGMGAVYRAVQRSLERTVAIKILPREFSADAAFCEGFTAEAKAMARLNHPNLIGVFDFGEVAGMLFIVMEYVHGQSLYHSAHGMAIDSGEVIRLVSGIGSGLAHAHDHGILHRDIKPANILLDTNAQPKIGDFGLARPVERKVQAGEEIFGTPHYTAPEVVNAPESVGYRADIFSLGVVLHELLTGKLPVDDSRPPSQIIGCDTRFDEIVRRATYHDPLYRYASATEMVNDLQAIIAGPLPAPKVAKVIAPQPPFQAPRKTVVYETQSSGFPTGLVFLLLLVIGGGAGYYYYKKHKEVPVVEAPSIVTQEPVLPKAEKPREAPVAPVIPSDPTSQGDGNSSAFGTPSTQVEPPAEPEIGPPIFDVNGFLDRGRRGMQRIVKSQLVPYQDQMKANCQSLENGLASNIRRLSASKRDAVMKELEKDYKEWQASGYRVPEVLPSSYNQISSAEAIHAPLLEKQKQLDQQVAAKLRTFSPKYIEGIQRQIDTLRTQNDPNAIKLLEKEVNQVKDDPEYFSGLIADKKPSGGQTTTDDGWIIPPSPSN